MSGPGPPRIAPPGVPHAVAHYLDNAAAYLRKFAKDADLELKPYEQYRDGLAQWHHALYGSCRDRAFCLQVVTDAASAPDFLADLRAYVRLYPIDGRNEWLLLERGPAQGMAALLKEAALMDRRLRLACAWRMPHPTDPDPKA